MTVENSPQQRHVGRYRLVVIGGDTAAIVAARTAARRGVRVALVQPPAPDDKPPQPGTLAEQIHHVQVRLGSAGLLELPAGSGVDVYPGQALFSQRSAVSVGGRELRFRKAVIATGSVSAPAEIDGAGQNGCLLPENLTELTELPRRLAVIGSGAVACGWAQAFRRFGSQVYLIARRGTILPDDDPDVSEMIRARLEEDHVRLYERCPELVIETTGNLRSVVIVRHGRKEKLLVDRILLCGPRRPSVVGLGLETAAVACDRRGLVVNDHLRTTNRRIFAAGAVCGPEFASAEAAEASARLAVHNALGLLRQDFSRLVIPRCIHTQPAAVQLGPARGEKGGGRIEVDTYRVDLSEADGSIPPHRRSGFVAVDVRRRTGRIVAITAVAEDVDELIAPLVLLMTRKRSLATLAKVIPCRPSRVELLTRLAERYLDSRKLRTKAGCTHPFWARRTGSRH